MSIRPFLTLCALLALSSSTTDGDLKSMLDECCTIGQEYFAQNGGHCNPYTSPILGIPDQMSCRSALQVCCLEKYREKQCLDGKEVAQNQRSCSALIFQGNNDDKLECCHCCKLGQVAGDAKADCDTIAESLPSCGATMRECCVQTTKEPAVEDEEEEDETVEEEEEEGQQSQQPVTSLPPLNPQFTVRPPDQHDESGMCARFPGQLCAHLCVDVTSDDFKCACFPGFDLMADRRTCKQQPLGDRCDLNNPCLHQCVDTGIAIQCRCFDGYMLHTDGKSCTDINECLVGTHTCSRTQTCVNLPGSYKCEGPSGGPDAGSELEGHGTVIQCQSGYAWNSLNNHCEDIDECIVRHHNCRSDQTCVNTQGSFRCENDLLGSCGIGYAWNRITRTCDDIDECLTDSHRCHGNRRVCRNTVGSYHCMCQRGFQYDPFRQQCEDINECALNQDSCLEGQGCENTLGSYHCRRSISCGTGYTLDRNSQQCIDDDECSLGTHNCGPGRECRNTLGSFRCETKECPLGYKLDFITGQCKSVVCSRGLKPDRAGNCVDINECVERPTVCRANQECRNTIGSFICRNLINCGPGYELNDAGTQCVDVDECEVGTHDCHGQGQQCVNRHGTYLCRCPEGYQMDHRLRRCEDIDECQRFSDSVCSQNANCLNTEGSFRCECKDGFEMDITGRRCKDVDECMLVGRCLHSCRNTWGSYTCMCFDGYQLSTDGRTCEDIDECTLYSERGSQLCVGVCENTDGSYICSCPDGYRMLGDARTCQDIDECALRTANCNGPEDICINTRGGYKCQTEACPKGFVRVPSRNNRHNNIRCQRQTFVCAQGDRECLYAPLSYSVNFMTFPSKITVPADLFTMRGPFSPYRRLDFELRLVSAQDPVTGITRVSRDFFKLRRQGRNEAVVELLEQIPGPQDVELELKMNIYSKEFGAGSTTQPSQDVFFGTAVAKINIFVTENNW